jgi:hypothetical protein
MTDTVEALAYFLDHHSYDTWKAPPILLCDGNVEWFEWDDEAFDDNEQGIPQLDSNEQPTGSMLTTEEVYEDHYDSNTDPFWLRSHKRYAFMKKESDNRCGTFENGQQWAGRTIRGYGEGERIFSSQTIEYVAISDMVLLCPWGRRRARAGDTSVERTSLAES